MFSNCCKTLLSKTMDYRNLGESLRITERGILVVHVHEINELLL